MTEHSEASKRVKSFQCQVRGLRKKLTNEEEYNYVLDMENGRNAAGRLLIVFDPNDLVLKDKGEKSRDFLIRNNIPLVLHYIKQKFSAFRDNDDLISVGYVGLIIGIDHLETKKLKTGKISTYISYWIKQQIIEYIKNKLGCIHIPSYLQEIRYQVTIRGLDFKDENLIKKTFKISNSKYQKLVATYKIENVLQNDDEICEFEYKGKIEPEDNENFNCQAVYHLLRHFTPKIQATLISYFIDGETYQAIGERLGLTREGIRQQVFCAVQRLKRLYPNKEYLQYQLRKI